MKTVLITGASRGLGRVLAAHLAQEGFFVVCQFKESQRNMEDFISKMREKGFSCESIYGDFSSQQSTSDFIANYLKSFPNTFSLINNVGNYCVKSLKKTSLKEARNLYQSNFFAPLQLIQGLLPSLESSCGVIINIGVAGLHSLRADTYSPLYTFTKQSLYSLTRSLALELAPQQVRVNMVSPGYLEHSLDKPKTLQRIPVQRLGTSQEVARVIAFLLHEDQSYLTGQNIEVAGGVRL